MSDPNNILIQAKELIYEGSYDEALQLLENLEEREEGEEIVLLKTLILKSKLMTYWGFYEEAYRLAERAILEGERLNKLLYVLDAFNEKREAMWGLMKDNEIVPLLENWEKVLRRLAEEGKEGTSEYKQRKAYLLLQKSRLLNSGGDSEQSWEHVKKCLSLFEEVDDKSGVGLAYAQMAATIGWEKDYEKFSSYLEKAKLIFEEIGDKKRVSMVIGYYPRL